MSNCKSFFSGYESRDSNCNSFNNRNMFDEFNGFTGYERGSFDGTRDRNFEYAKGRGSLTSLGGNPAERAVADGDDICDQPKCGNMGGVYRRCRKNGCTCTDMSVPNGQCVSEKSRRGQMGIAQQKKMGLRDASGRKVNLTPQQVAAREVADPTGWGCEDISCGSYSGGGRKRCPKGCKCKGGWCVSKNRREDQGGVTPAARQVQGGAAFSGRDMSNGGFRLR